MEIKNIVLLEFGGKMPRVVVVYDISLLNEGAQKRMNRIRQICRRYLYQVQKSVFEGELSEGKIKQLEVLLRKNAEQDSDSVIMYVFDERCPIKRIFITNTKDPTDNFI